MYSDKEFKEPMNQLKRSFKDLKQVADELGADIETYSIEYRLYLEAEYPYKFQRNAAEKRKEVFEEKSKNKHFKI